MLVITIALGFEYFMKHVDAKSHTCCRLDSTQNFEYILTFCSLINHLINFYGILFGALLVAFWDWMWKQCELNTIFTQFHWIFHRLHPEMCSIILVLGKFDIQIFHKFPLLRLESYSHSSFEFSTECSCSLTPNRCTILICEHEFSLWFFD